jgi:hypothetical protein
MNDNINFMWVGKELTEIGIICLNSFHFLGYKCILWIYNDISNVPDFVVLKDANKIVTKYDGRTELFSDYFRYKLLYSQGGIWSDLDNVLLCKLPTDKYILSGDLLGAANSHIIKTPAGCPMLGSIIKEIEHKLIFDYTQTFNGVYLLDKINEFELNIYMLSSYKLNFFYNDMIRLCLEDFNWSEIDSCYCIHLFESQHRAVYKTNKTYMKNLSTLKNINSK